eukprot:Nitzschia sp. Nitz4//scaffold43_size134323//95185//96530//NITZ4_003313-RA/size134323-augustus-gene-0.241-mRNA-1//-1//CDS//3329551990//2785//frame0
MGKRENEHSQLSKEDYEALESRDSGNPEGIFSQASPEVLSRRRIIRSRRPTQSSTPPAPSGGGVFGGISLVPASGASTMASKQPAPSKPSFVLPSSTVATNFPMSSSSKPTSTSAPVSEEEKKLTTKIVDFLQDLPDREDFYRACVQYTNRLNVIREKNKPAVSSTNTPSSNTSSVPAPAPPAKAAAFSFTAGATTEKTEPSKATAFSFGASTAAAPTPASSGFSFGASTTSAAAATPASGFSFGASSTTTTAPPASSGFSFSPSASSAVVPGANVKVALTPVAADGEPSDEPQEQEPSAPMENADAKDWDELYTTKVKAYRQHIETKRWTRFATSTIRLQRNKNTGKPRMVIRDVSGKVLLNVGISSDMTFSKFIEEKKNLAKIAFKGIMDEEKGVESYMLVCRMDELDDLHSNLQSLTK